MTFRTRPLFHENCFTTESIRSTPQSPVSSITDSPRSTSAQVVNGKRQTRNSTSDPKAPAWQHRTQPGQSSVRSFEDGTITSSSPTLGSISHKIVFLRHRILASSSDEVVRWAALPPSCNARAMAGGYEFLEDPIGSPSRFPAKSPRYESIRFCDRFTVSLMVRRPARGRSGCPRRLTPDRRWCATRRRAQTTLHSRERSMPTS